MHWKMQAFLTCLELRVLLKVIKAQIFPENAIHIIILPLGFCPVSGRLQNIPPPHPPGSLAHTPPAPRFYSSTSAEEMAPYTCLSGQLAGRKQQPLLPNQDKPLIHACGSFACGTGAPLLIRLASLMSCVLEHSNTSEPQEKHAINN